jgi:co-chaperonin GroES (HSP10)
MGLGGGDKLAKGARSAQFAGGHATVDDEIIINPSMVSQENQEEPSLTVIDKRHNYLDSFKEVKVAENTVVKEFPDKEYEIGRPILDRLLVMRVSIDPDEELLEDGSVRNKKTGIITSSAYRQHTNTGIVLATGGSVVMGGVKFPTSDFVKPGDRIFYGDYNSELFPIDEERVKQLCRAIKVNYEKVENGIRLIRVQDVRMVESPKEN